MYREMSFLVEMFNKSVFFLFENLTDVLAISFYHLVLCKSHVKVSWLFTYNTKMLIEIPSSVFPFPPGFAPMIPNPIIAW